MPSVTNACMITVLTSQLLWLFMIQLMGLGREASVQMQTEMTKEREDIRTGAHL